MAAVQVSTFAEFAQAVQVSGDTVICPEKAVWDFNELYPEGWGSGSMITAKCSKVTGNGTTILNAHTRDWIIYYQSQCEIDSLNIENIVTENGMVFAVNQGNYIFRNCRFSGILSEYPGSYAGLYNTNGAATQFLSCAFTLESATSQAFRILWNLNADNDVKKYCRIRLYLPNSAGYTGENTQWSQVNVDCPAQTSLYIGGACANVYGGDLPQVSSVSGSIQSYISVFNEEEIPNLSSTASIMGCTTTQLHSSVYLSSIGFPIGVKE